MTSVSASFFFGGGETKVVVEMRPQTKSWFLKMLFREKGLKTVKCQKVVNTERILHAHHLAFIDSKKYEEHLSIYLSTRFLPT